MSTGRVHQAENVGVFTPKRQEKEALGAGEVGFVIAGIKEIDGAPVGDPITHADRRADSPLPGFQEIRPRVFAGLYPVVSDDSEGLTLGQLQEVGEEVGLHPERVAAAAASLETRSGVLPAALASDSRNNRFPSFPIPIQSTAHSTTGRSLPIKTTPRQLNGCVISLVGTYASGLPMGGDASTANVPTRSSPATAGCVTNPSTPITTAAFSRPPRLRAKRPVCQK